MYFAIRGRDQHTVAKRMTLNDVYRPQATRQLWVTDFATKLHRSLHESSVGPRRKFQAASLWRGCLTRVVRFRLS